MLEAGKVAHWLRALAAFAENLSSVSSIQARQLTTSYSYSSRGTLHRLLAPMGTAG